VPLHANVINAGFLDYVAKIESAGHSMLFPHLISGKNGYSKNASRRFGQYLTKLGIKAKGKSFHSFRATFITRMSAKGAHPAMLMALVGHYNQANVDLSSPHFDNYQDAKLIKELKATMDLFDPPVASIPKTFYSHPVQKRSVDRNKKG
jgi:integrase